MIVDKWFINLFKRAPRKIGTANWVTPVNKLYLLSYLMHAVYLSFACIYIYIYIYIYISSYVIYIYIYIYKQLWILQSLIK